jgi:hypothetical protein
VPVPYANLTNPQTLNLYSMVADDPESFADLDGHVDAPNQEANNACAGSQSCADDKKRQENGRKAQNKSWWQKALSYFYVKTGNGRGIGVNDVKVGPLKADIIFRTHGKEAKHTTDGKTVTDVNSQIGVKFGIGPAKLGVERTQEDDKKPEWVPGFAFGKFEGSNAEVGVGAGGCFVLCGQIEVGVQADKVLSDIGNAVGNAVSDYVTSRIKPNELAPSGGDSGPDQ